MESQNKKSDMDKAQHVDDLLIKKSTMAIRFTRYTLLIAAVFIAALLLFINRDQLNGDNFRRLMAKIDISVSMRGDVDGKEIDLSLTQDSKVRPFKDGMACLTPSRLTVMDNIGTVFLDTSAGFSKPEMLTNEKYVLAYDRGGHALMLTNSFTVVAKKEFDDPIYLARMNDAGAMVVITLSKGYRCTVHAFDADFEEIFTWQSADRYVVDADISPDGQAVVMSCYNVKDAANKAELVCFKFSSDQMAWNISIGEQVSAAVRYKTNHTICVLQQQRLVFINHKGEQVGEYFFDNQFVQSYNLENNDYTALTLSSSSLGYSTLCIINNKGKLTASQTLDRRVLQLETKGKQIGMLSDRGACVYAADSKRMIWEKNVSGIKTICFGGKNCLLVVSETKAVYNVIK